MLRMADMAVKRGAETSVPVEVSIDDSNDFLLPNFNVNVEIAKEMLGTIKHNLPRVTYIIIRNKMA